MTENTVSMHTHIGAPKSAAWELLADFGRPHAAQNDPKQRICGLQVARRLLRRENGELLAKGEVLQQEVAARGKEATEPAGKDR